MLRLFGDVNFKWMSTRKFAYIASGALIVASAISLIAQGGPRLGVDFTGGTVIEVKIEPPLRAELIRSIVTNTVPGKPEIQSIGREGAYLFRLQSGEEKTDVFPSIKAAIETSVPGTTVDLLSEETVGPKIGRELRSKAVWAVLIALAGILVYVGWRYEFMMALGAVLALFHDVFITIGFLSFLRVEISLTVLAALLTIAGYSINDTIVVFDRVREQSRLLRRESFQGVIDISVNQTLSRTILTVLTTLLTVTALLIWGGDVIHDFALTTLIGIGLGTYSSIYVASALALDIRGPETIRLRK
jgi:preprotein translocase subunit SecF